MLDVDTFLTTLYATADEFCQTHRAELPPETRPGPAAALTRSEVLTLALIGQWRRFESERAFYRYVARYWRPYFPTLPRRSQFNRLVRRERVALAAFGLALAERPEGRTWRDAAYEALDGTAAPVRQVKRRGHGWFAGQADRGWSNHLGWYCGFHLLASVTPGGAITGFGLGPASANERPLAEAFFAARRRPLPQLPWVGHPVGARAVFYATDTGFEGRAAHARWRAAYGADVVSPPTRGADPARPAGVPKATRQWPRRWRRWVAGLRQVVETVFAKLHHTFRLLDERPHALDGGFARRAAKVALPTFCLWRNCRLGRPRLAFADLVAWP
jgi:hypothetical protein